MLLRNKYHKKLHFEVNNHSVGINAYGVLSVEKEDAKILLKNKWIELANPKIEKEIVDVKVKEERPIHKIEIVNIEKEKIDSKIPELVINKKSKVIKDKGRINS